MIYKSIFLPFFLIWMFFVALLLLMLYSYPNHSNQEITEIKCVGGLAFYVWEDRTISMPHHKDGNGIPCILESKHRQG